MARRSENWSRLEVRAVIRFLRAKNVSASDIQPNRENLWQDVENRSAAGCGRVSSTTTEINTARVEEMIQNDRRVTLREISSELGLSFW
ncbi:hypothetical protein CEXT_111841 [Caerostris extrusa]|uniref:Uncharacterized protein n=1 Tax=Caerostris extrusa TaxID=172846 RepID=A0AAV4MAT1_CAEEX|nr:hypothetical protein CEXT_111841 [Caerostris extrusa]